jgi:hypothetical protein
MTKLKPLNLLLATVLILVSLGYSNHALAQQSPPDPDTFLAPYNVAIYDSSVYKFSNLRPLLPLKFDAEKRAKVVSLTAFPYTTGDTKLPVDLWVTVVPEVQTICQGFSGDLSLRLRQLLGLHPAKRFSNFVVISVSEGAIFRPAPNPDPTTVLPCSNSIPANCGEAFPENVTEKHLRWIAQQMLSHYVISESPLIPVGYPWTRLGYTYDWKPGANKYGASEYVIGKGSTIKVLEIIPYQTYCRPDK